MGEGHANHRSAIRVESLHARRGSSHHFLFVEAHRFTVVARDDDFVIASCRFHIPQLVAFAQRDRDLAVFIDVVELRHRRAFRQSVFRDKQQRLDAFLVFRDRQQRLHFFIRQQLDNIDDWQSFRRAGSVWNVVALQTIHPSFVRKQQNVVMRRHRHHRIHRILFVERHGFDSASAAVLGVVRIDRLPFNIA